MITSTHRAAYRYTAPAPLRRVPDRQDTPHRPLRLIEHFERFDRGDDVTVELDRQASTRRMTRGFSFDVPGKF
jgi:hypothetical protein